MDEVTEAIHTLFERYADDVYRYAKYSLPSDFDAKDVVQEVFLRAFHHWEHFNGNADAKTWLFKIARNYIYDLLRKKKRQLVYESQMPRTSHAAQLDTVIELEEALQQLSLTHRQILTLRWIQGLTVPETADVLGWSESKVRVTFHRAKKKLSSALQPQIEIDARSNGGGTAYGK